MSTRALGPFFTFACASLLTLACRSRPDPAPNAIVEIASANPVLMGAQPAVKETTKAEAAPSLRRPMDEGDLVLTAERRARIEQAFPETKGFLQLSDLEAKLQKLPLLRGKEEPAVQALDRLAKDKWVLFTGYLMMPVGDRFTMPLRYTRRESTDRLGLTSTWFGIELREIRGYVFGQHPTGELMAVLAKYNGQKLASPGYDLVLLERWF
jgi:hypothetical protein